MQLEHPSGTVHFNFLEPLIDDDDGWVRGEEERPGKGSLAPSNGLRVA